MRERRVTGPLIKNDKFSSEIFLASLLKTWEHPATPDVSCKRMR